MADRSVRPAIPDDAPRIAAVQQAAIAADHPELDPKVSAALGSEAAVSAWEQAVRRPPSPRHRVLSALEDQALVGFVAFAPSAEEPAAVELLELRVHPDHTRQGHGSRLLAATVDVLAPEQVPALLCWSATDSPLDGLLAATGWAVDGGLRELEAPGARIAQRRWRTRLHDES